jgi:glycerate-2-kinase
MVIQNRDALISHGNIPGRVIVVDILEAGLQAANPYYNTKSLLNLQSDGHLIAGRSGFPIEQPRGHPVRYEPLIIDLNQMRNIYVVGGGKAAQSMAKAIEDVLEPYITDGQVNARKGEPLLCNRIHVTFAGHPIPDSDSVEGAKRMRELEKKATKGDLVFLTESGGGTALMALPADGVSLNDVQDVYRQLYFERGASMSDANAVRWLLCDLRGRHERYIGDATMIAFHTSENHDGLTIAANRKSPEHRARPADWSYDYAIKVLKRYEIWDTVSSAVRKQLEKADPRYEMLHPNEVLGKPHYHFRVMGSEYMLDAAQQKAIELGIPAHIISSSMNNLEVWPVAGVVAHIARESEFYGRPFQPPCVLLFGGELLVTVGTATGIGGRNQEFVLSTAPMIAGSQNIVIASVDSDGADGPSPVAGGIVDGDTVNRLSDIGVNVFQILDNHDSYGALTQLDDAIHGEIRSTNVRDLRAIYIQKRVNQEELQHYVDTNQLTLYGFHVASKNVE